MHSPAWLLTSFYCKMSNCNLDHREDLSRLEFWFQKIRNSLLFFKAKTNQNPDAGFVFDRSMVLCFHVTNFHESFSELDLQSTPYPLHSSSNSPDASMKRSRSLFDLTSKKAKREKALDRFYEFANRLETANSVEMSQVLVKDKSRRTTHVCAGS